MKIDKLKSNIVQVKVTLVPRPIDYIYWLRFMALWRKVSSGGHLEQFVYLAIASFCPGNANWLLYQTILLTSL